MDEYDCIVIGAGPVGENVADRAVAGGLRTVIVERELVGGDCSYWACIPSKGMLRPGAALRAAAAVDGARQAVTGGVDPAAVLRRRDAMVHGWDDAGQVEWVTGAGIDLIRGHARIDGPKRVTVTAADGTMRTLVARHAVAVCTGSDAAVPAIPGLREVEPWTSRDATGVRDVPASLAIIGGGVVACEMATAFLDLGSTVTVIARGRLLGGQEPFAGELVGAALTARGASVRTGTGTSAVRRTPDGVAIELADGDVVTAERVLLATGRTPRTGDLGLDTVGLDPGAWLEVDDTMRVRGTDWLYGVGDVNHRALLTHQGKYQARAAGDAIAARAQGRAVDEAPWGAHVATADHAAVPQVTFTDPEVASVGRTAADAAAAGLRTRVLDVDLGALAGAGAHRDGYEGRARAVVDEDRGVLVGVTFVGPGVGEMLQAATIAVTAEVPLSRLWHAVPAFPTLSEVWLRFLEAYGRPTP